MNKPKLEVVNAQRKMRLDSEALQAFAVKALELAFTVESRAGDVLKSVDAIDVVLVTDRRIAQLHKRFMKIAGPTDVITFQHGEIVVSVETAVRQAAQYGTSAEDEIRLYIVHGILHLRGFDDTTPEGAREMMKVQEWIAAAARER